MSNCPISEKAKLGDKFLLLMSDKIAIDGIEIATTGTMSTLHKVAESLAQIRAYDSVCYRRMLQDIRLIWVRLLPGNLARFSSSLSACELDTRFVLDQPSEFIAAAIVHEATHARLWRRGIRYDEESRFRVERACLRQEYRFASRLPDAQDLLDWTEAALANPPHFTDAEAVKHFELGSLDALRYRGAPEWLLGLLIRFRDLVRRIGLGKRDQ
jgi:hypothetical protein